MNICVQLEMFHSSSCDYVCALLEYDMYNGHYTCIESIYPHYKIEMGAVA